MSIARCDGLAAGAVTWSYQQRAALAEIERWYGRRHRLLFYLAGHAGTGKTTLAAEVAQRVGSVVFAAFTGKAADVMRRKGCAEASTIDSLIYLPKMQLSCVASPPCQNPPCTRDCCPHLRERFVGRRLNDNSAVADANLVIIDEVSMVGEQMGYDLLSFGTPVLTLGDLGQLPPIKGAGFFTSSSPDFELTEVHRQALGSPVIKLATLAREGRLLPGGYHGDSVVRHQASIDDMLAHDQVIVGTHRMRHRLNQQIRRKLGFTGATPADGEKVLCLKNNKDKGLHNGALWTVVKAAQPRGGFIELELEDDRGRRVDVMAPVRGFCVRDGSGGELPGQPFTYGYAITCHKAQGSQWGSVLIVDESRVFREHRHRWLYTAITRAADRVTVVRP